MSTASELFSPVQESEPVNVSEELNLNVKLALPLQESKSPEGTIGSEINYPIYLKEQHQTWAKLYLFQEEAIAHQKYFCDEYIEGFKQIEFTKEKICPLSHANDMLMQKTSWRVMRVNGYVKTQEFFKLLARKIFACTDLIRIKTELEFSQLPDTFHDQVGHLPMLMHEKFARFFNLIGIAGCNVIETEQFVWLERLYWYTAEVGLINPTAGKNFYDSSKTRIYGASIATSSYERDYALSSNVQRRNFVIDEVINTPYIINEPQRVLFEVSSFEVLEKLVREWLIKNRLIPISCWAA